MDSYDISASALSAQRLRLDIIASNLANANSTRRADGESGPYKKKTVVFAEMMQNTQYGFGGSTSNNSDSSGASKQSTAADGTVTLNAGVTHQDYVGSGVQVTKIIEDEQTPTRRVYDPSHPDADTDGYVEMPNINPVTELVDMISASRAYEASVTALQSTKTMEKASLEI